MRDKKTRLHEMMQDVSRCQLCCAKGSGAARTRLINLIAKNPEAPRYGEIPSIYTDWASRLNAKIAIILQDWGSRDDALKLRHHYECLLRTESLSREKAWRRTVQYRPKPSPTHKRIPLYLKRSAEREGLQLPADFVDHLFFTNAVLCFRKGNSSGANNINLERSIRNCCFKRKFLKRQLQIVSPSIVVALGGGALRGLGLRKKISDVIRSAQSSPQGFLEREYEGLPLNIVAVLHPTARIPRGSTRKQQDDKQIEDYRYIWKALSHILRLKGAKLVSTYFPNSRG